MDIAPLSSFQISEFIPNVLANVTGETPLVDKLHHYIIDAKKWIETEYLGCDDFLSDSHNLLALKIVVTKAFADAVPALDVVVTPTGMAVVKTDTLVPASKDRTDRLINALRAYVDANIALLVDICRTYPLWRKSERGRYFCSTFISSLSFLHEFPADARPDYAWVHDNALDIERLMEMDYLGKSVMALLRTSHNCDKFPVFPDVADEIISFIKQNLRERFTKKTSDPKKCLAWNNVRGILYSIRSVPELWEMRQKEITDLCSINRKKGAYFF